MNSYVVNSVLLNRYYDIVVIPIQLSTSISNIGRWSIGKIGRLLLVWLRFFGKILDRKSYDLAYLALPTIGAAFYTCLPLIGLARLRSVPLLLHLHGKGVRQQARSSTIFRALFVWAVRDAKVIVHTPLLYNDIEEFVSRDDVVFIPNGVPPVHATLEILDRPRRGVTKIVFISNLIEAKGPVVLLDALAILVERGVSFDAIFAGAESEKISAKSFHAEIVRRGLGERVQYVGPLSGERKDLLLLDADVLAFPTFYVNETFSLVLLEAMSAGLAIVTTPEGSIPDIIQEGLNGFLVPQRDCHALANALERLIRNPVLRVAMGQRNRDKFEQEFRIEHFERRLHGVWTEMTCAKNTTHSALL